MRHHGLDSGIGTFTHTINAISPEELKAASDKAKESNRSRAKRRQRDLTRRELGHELRTMILSILYCTHCGDQIPYSNETSEEWGKRRLCDKCLSQKKKLPSQDFKFCRYCGKKIFKVDYLEPVGKYRTWAPVRNCTECAEIGQRIAAAVRKKVREVIV